MSLRTTVITQGPKRGIGKYKPSKPKQPKPVSKPSPVGYRLSDYLPKGTSIQPMFPPEKSSKPPKNVRIVPFYEDENGKFHFIPHEGPKRGIGLGPAAYTKSPIYHPHEGPKRGVGTMLIQGDGFTNNPDAKSASPNDILCVNLVNNFRKENHLPPLQYSKQLSTIAMPHTLDMLNHKVPLGHSGFHERSAKVSYASATGENVGYEKGYDEPIKVLFEGWLNSPPHRKNMLGNFNQIGVAFANHGDLWYGTQFFAYI